MYPSAWMRPCISTIPVVSLISIKLYAKKIELACEGTRAICRLAGRFLAIAFRKMLILASGQYDYPFKCAWYAADYKAVAY